MINQKFDHVEIICTCGWARAGRIVKGVLHTVVVGVAAIPVIESFEHLKGGASNYSIEFEIIRVGRD